MYFLKQRDVINTASVQLMRGGVRIVLEYHLHDKAAFSVLCMMAAVIYYCTFGVFFFFMQKPAYEWRISDWSSDVCSSDLRAVADAHLSGEGGVVVLACPKYRGPAVRCRRRRQLQKIGCILALHVVQTKQLYRSTHMR